MIFALFAGPGMAAAEQDRSAIRQAATLLIANGADRTAVEALYRKTSSLPAPEASRIFDNLQQLQQQGLPIDLVANKYNEGLTKRVRLQLIERATVELGNKLQQAQQLCDSLPGTAKKDGNLITAVARQLNYGQQTATMSQIINAYAEAGKKDPQAASSRQVMTGLGAVSSMAAAGYSGEEAGNFVSAAVSNNYSGEEIERLGRILSLARSEGLADNDSLRQITRERVRFGARALIRSFGVSAGQSDVNGKSGQQLENSRQGGVIPTRPQPAGLTEVEKDKVKDSMGIGHGVTDGGSSSGGNPPPGNNESPGQQ